MMKTAIAVAVVLAGCGGSGRGDDVGDDVVGDDGGGDDEVLPGPGEGAVRVTTLCAPNVCGRTGNLHNDIVMCETGAVIDSQWNPDIQVSSGDPIVHDFPAIVEGARCVDAWLDSNFNSNRDGNDAIVSFGFVPVLVTAGATATAVVTLDVVIP
jgi:hypothetical protein